MKEERCGNAGRGVPVENSCLALWVIQARHRVSHRHPSPLEIANRAISTFPQRRLPLSFFFFKPKDKAKPAPLGRSQREHIHERRNVRSLDQRSLNFQAHPALESKSDFRLTLHWNQKSISGSFLDWKMLAIPLGVGGFE